MSPVEYYQHLKEERLSGNISYNEYEMALKMMAFEGSWINQEGCEVLYEIEELEEFVDDGKYSLGATILKYEDEFYYVPITRSGSYYTDYHFEIEKPFKVYKKPVTTHIWEEVEKR